MDEIDDFDFCTAQSIDQPVTLHEELSNGWIAFFRNDAPSFGEVPK